MAAGRNLLPFFSHGEEETSEVLQIWHGFN